MKLINQKITLSLCIGTFLLFVTSLGLADIKLLLSKDKINFPMAEFSITGKEALQLWEYLAKSEKQGGFVTGSAAMGTSSLESPVVTCFHENPDNYGSRYYHDGDDYITAHNKAEKDPSLYRCNIKIDQNGLAKK
ncbi:MAG: hypothetical protein A2X78_00755 [Gammaproteobacteria bacterium GWE2_37_16]|nr:MAG: hypothetical protein A2X78_00755 [Gammaproteobacteria bacterium GWE2_37_16]